MKYVFQILLATSLLVTACDDSRRASDGSFGEGRNEAAGEPREDPAEAKTRRDAEFVNRVVASHYSELKLAELAKQRSRTPEIKEIAVTILADYSSSLNELKTLAQARDITIPVEEPDEARQTLQDLADESGKDFDKEWVGEMLRHHTRNIRWFSERLEDSEDAELKDYISKTLSLLEEHRKTLEACKKHMDSQK